MTKPRAPIADGTGRWSRRELARRYEAACRHAGQRPTIANLEHAGRHFHEPWIAPLIDRVIEGIKAGDRGCITIGLELIEEDAKFAFGKIIKANTAKALRKAPLTEADKQRIRARVAGLLLRGHAPHEMRQYARLMKFIGLGSQKPVLEGELARLIQPGTPANPYVLRFLRYLTNPFLGPWGGS